MKIIKIILLTLVVLVLIIAGGSLGIRRYIAQRAIPDYNARVRLEGLQDRAEVIRDSLGIPHIYAGNEEDLYRVTGYVMAQDRLWQMDILRRAAQGRLSELLGPDMITNDLLFRALRIQEKSRLLMAGTEPEIIRCLAAFSDGINQYIRDAGKNLPFEFTVLQYKPEPWLPIHTINLVGFISWGSSAAWKNETSLYRVARLVGEEKARELIPDIDIQEPILPDFMIEGDPVIELDLISGPELIDNYGIQAFMASNNWAVSGEHTSGGYPIVSNDMHLQINTAPGVWYQLHQVIPGRLNVSGIALPGNPFVNVGHNDSVAWGMTYVAVDDIDFYLETINPSDSNQYLLDGNWEYMEIREEIIGIRGEDSIRRYNRFTHRGPVISSFRGIEDKVISMRWTGNEYSNEIRTAYLLDHADNVYDIREALRTWQSISTNTVCADASGNIAMFIFSRIPLRPGNRALVMPGDTSRYDWIGFVPMEQQPRVINPPSGILASANNRSVGPDYPYHISCWYAVPHRYNRIMELLSEKEIFDARDMMDMQSDQHSWLARHLMSRCNPVLLDADMSGLPLAAYDRIHTWEGDMSGDQIEPSLFEVFYSKLAEAIFLDELGEEFYPKLSSTLIEGVIDRILKGQKISWCDDVNTADTAESFDDLLVPAWIAAVNWLAENFGSDMETWKWKDLHTVSMNHPLASVDILNRIFQLERGPYGIGGSGHTVSPYSYSRNNPFVVTNGASQRHIYDLVNPDSSWIITPTGASGIPESVFFCNQTRMYLDNLYIHESFSRKRVEENEAFRAVYHYR